MPLSRGEVRHDDKDIQVLVGLTSQLTPGQISIRKTQQVLQQEKGKMTARKTKGKQFSQTQLVAMATVKLSKQISDKIRELNALGTFLADIRLGAVARKLSELPVEKALECLQSVVDAAEMGEEDAQNDPTQAVIKVGWVGSSKISLQQCRLKRHCPISAISARNEF